MRAFLLLDADLSLSRRSLFSAPPYVAEVGHVFVAGYPGALVALVGTDAEVFTGPNLRVLTIDKSVLGAVRCHYGIGNAGSTDGWGRADRRDGVVDVTGFGAGTSQPGKRQVRSRQRTNRCSIADGR